MGIRFFMFVQVLIVGLFSLSFVVGAQASDNNIEASRQVIENQLQAFKRQDHATAFTFASPGIQNAVNNVDKFIAMVRRGYEPIYSAKSWRFGRAKTDDQKVHHEVLVSGPGGGSWVALYTMHRQADGSWRVSGVYLRKYKATST